jgi:hypothetical protein
VSSRSYSTSWRTGPLPVKTIEERAVVRGFSKDQLDRAKKKMGVVSFKEKVLQGRSFWAAVNSHS